MCRGTEDVFYISEFRESLNVSFPTEIRRENFCYIESGKEKSVRW